MGFVLLDVGKDIPLTNHVAIGRILYQGSKIRTITAGPLDLFA